jgi:curved DNA-binding protein CbpA
VAKVVDPALAKLLKEAADMQRTVMASDFFGVLGVKRDASDGDVRSAYLALVRKWHPDRLPGASDEGGGDLKAMVSTIFLAVGDAYETLQEKANRAEYLKDLEKREASGATGAAAGARMRSPRAEEAKLNAQKGRVFLAKKNYDEAERHYKRAAELDPDLHEYKTELAWAHSLNPNLPPDERRAKALEMLLELCGNTRHADAFYKLGLLQRVFGGVQACEENIRKAAQLDPSHVEARREVRVFDMRAEKARSETADVKTGGLLSRLKKRS